MFIKQITAMWNTCKYYLYDLGILSKAKHCLYTYVYWWSFSVATVSLYPFWWHYICFMCYVFYVLRLTKPGRVRTQSVKDPQSFQIKCYILIGIILTPRTFCLHMCDKIFGIIYSSIKALRLVLQTLFFKVKTTLYAIHYNVKLCIWLRSSMIQHIHSRSDRDDSNVA